MRREVSAVVFDMERNMFLLVKLVPPYHRFWRLIKGGIEDGETNREALYRELREEVGLKGCIESGELVHYQFTMYGLSHDVTTYLVLTKGEPITLNKRELTAYTFANWRKVIQFITFRNELEAVNKAVDMIKNAEKMKVLYNDGNRVPISMHDMR